MNFTVVCNSGGTEQLQTSSGRTSKSSSHLRSNPTLQKGSGLFCLYVALKFVSTSLPFPAGSVIASISGLITSCQVRHEKVAISTPPATAAWCEAHGTDIYTLRRAEEVTGLTATKRQTNTSAAAAFVIIWYRVRLIVLFSRLLDLEKHLQFADAGRATV